MQSLVRTSSRLCTQLHFTAPSPQPHPCREKAHTRQVGQCLISMWLKGVLSSHALEERCGFSEGVVQLSATDKLILRFGLCLLQGQWPWERH